MGWQLKKSFQESAASGGGTALIRPEAVAEADAVAEAEAVADVVVAALAVQGAASALITTPVRDGHEVV
jgi:hypothetical protein